jgi:hypothetical protein
MDDKDLKEAKQVLEDVKIMSKGVSRYNPTEEVEYALVSLLRHRINKLNTDVEFEQHVKDAMLARLPEANFSELILLLDRLQTNTNISVEKILSPFIPKAGERVPLLDQDKANNKNTEETVFDSASKDTLQALSELAKAVRLIKNQRPQIEVKVEDKKSPD